MSCNNSQVSTINTTDVSAVSTINTPDVSTGFIDFLANGEFDEMLSSTPRRVYYSTLLNQEDGDEHEKQNDAWGGEDAKAIDAICSEAMDKFIWGEDYTDEDDKALDEICSKIESSK